MELTVTTFTSLDGVMQGPGAPDEDRSGGFELGGWVVPYAEDMGPVDEIFDRATAFLLGRSTYDMMYAFWSQLADSDDVVAQKLNGLPKYVVSTTLTDPAWHDTRVIDGTDPAAAIRALKAEGEGELQVHGSAGLIQTLLAEGLVDRYHVLTFPVVLGTGKRLFDGGAVPAALALEGTTVTSTGVVAATYRAAGALRAGEIAIEDGQEVLR